MNPAQQPIQTDGGLHGEPPFPETDLTEQQIANLLQAAKVPPEQPIPTPRTIAHYSSGHSLVEDMRFASSLEHELWAAKSWNTEFLPLVKSLQKLQSELTIVKGEIAERDRMAEFNEKAYQELKEERDKLRKALTHYADIAGTTAMEYDTGKVARDALSKSTTQ